MSDYYYLIDHTDQKVIHFDHMVKSPNLTYSTSAIALISYMQDNPEHKFSVCSSSDYDFFEDWEMIDLCENPLYS